MADETKLLQLTRIFLKNFRCFDQITLDLDEPVLLIQGANGSGKTSLLEALHYTCYLRSFRTHLPKDLLMFGKNNFFIKTTFRETSAQLSLSNEIQVGFTGDKRLVKINQKPITAYKELMDHYRVISITEDDLALIKGSPQIRRVFIDQAIVLVETEFITNFRNFRRILDSRNKLLQQATTDQDSYYIWTQQLWKISNIIQRKRQQVLAIFSQEINSLLTKHFDALWSIVFTYKAKNMSATGSFDNFMRTEQSFFHEEKRYGRSLFGAHLDDIVINLQGKKSKSFASRGQQKLIILLIKIAQIKYLSTQKGPAIFLLDDFMTDFDPERAQLFISILLNLKIQLVFTSPVKGGEIEKRLCAEGARSLFLTH